MTLNVSDLRIQHTITIAEHIINSNPSLDEIMESWDNMLEYKEHFYNWYGEGSSEYNLICAMVNLLRMIKTFIDTSSAKDNGGKMAGSLDFQKWLGEQPIRNALRIRLSKCIFHAVSLTS